MIGLVVSGLVAPALAQECPTDAAACERLAARLVLQVEKASWAEPGFHASDAMRAPWEAWCSPTH